MYNENESILIEGNFTRDNIPKLIEVVGQVLGQEIYYPDKEVLESYKVGMELLDKWYTMSNDWFLNVDPAGISIRYRYKLEKELGDSLYNIISWRLRFTRGRRQSKCWE